MIHASKSLQSNLCLSRLLLVLLCPCLIAGTSAVLAQDVPGEAEIRRIRALSNQAMSDRDIDTFLSTLMPDYHVVTSTNLQLSGHEAQRQLMKKVFETYPDAVYERMPVDIDVSADGRSAAESGNWTGQWTDKEKKISLRGSYFAKWTRSDGQWLLQAEVFVIL